REPRSGRLLPYVLEHRRLARTRLASAASGIAAIQPPAHPLGEVDAQPHPPGSVGFDEVSGGVSVGVVVGVDPGAVGAATSIATVSTASPDGPDTVRVTTCSPGSRSTDAVSPSAEPPSHDHVHDAIPWVSLDADPSSVTGEGAPHWSGPASARSGCG